MTKDERKLETLARDICWLGFSAPYRKAKGDKLAYWNSIEERAREQYRREAALLCWHIRQLGERRILKILADRP